MVNVFLERNFDPAITASDVLEMTEAAGGCFNVHQVSWVQSFLATSGNRMLCWFQAPDLDSIRQALRKSQVDPRHSWAGDVFDAPVMPNADLANVVVERSWEEPVALEDIQAIEDAGIHCLENHRVTFVRTFFSTDRKRMMCLYQAPDAESVRVAQHQAGMPLERVWHYTSVSTADL